MVSKIERFFFRLTLENWGFPWHIILCWGAVNLGQLLFLTEWVAPVVFAVGVLYEIYQIIQYKRRAAYQECNYIRDMWQDLIADAIGVLLGILL